MAERKVDLRELDEFTKINMRGIGKVFVEQGKQQKVEIEGDQVSISRITTEVKDGKLVIDVGRDFIEKLSAGFDFLSSNNIKI